MPQIRLSCGHLKRSYDNHSSCLNCSGCFRSNCCSVCHSWSDLTWSLVGRHRHFCDRQMGKKKEAKVKERKDSTSRNSSSSRPGLEQTVAQDDPPGPTTDSHDDDAALVLSLSSSGDERVRRSPRFQAVEAHTEHHVLVRRDGGAIVPPRPDPMPVPGTRFHRPSRVNRVLRPHRVHRSQQVIRSHRVTWSDQFTLVRKLKRKKPTSVWTSLSFLFLIHWTDRCN